jgi:hypothetical protein
MVWIDCIVHRTRVLVERLKAQEPGGGRKMPPVHESEPSHLVNRLHLRVLQIHYSSEQSECLGSEQTCKCFNTAHNHEREFRRILRRLNHTSFLFLQSSVVTVVSMLFPEGKFHHLRANRFETARCPVVSDN